ncbi:hypothetical protein C8Q74DRAFT_59910 [Fomes fomentarius]|nr:hypothetical protein C8Q74DRAFT_59910 [Fomes fomentarius]
MSSQPKPTQGGDAAHIFHPPTSSDTLPESPSTTNAFHLSIRIISYVLLHILLKTFAILQVCSAAAHEHICRLFALPPCQVHGPRESAIVIVGGDHELGRHIAFNFSELGYTVFVLCPDRRAAIQPATDASNVSSLIQEWHTRIKRSGHSATPWGLLAPIVLDMTSHAQRTRAFETVDAYCATHTLYLVAVIVLPAPKFITRTGLNISAWGDVVRECLVEPISVVQDYVNLLTAASGRVVLLLASGHQPWIPSLYKGVLRSVAQYLRQELNVLGIKISTVTAGPSAPITDASAPIRSEPSHSVTAGNTLHKRSGKTQRTTQDYFPSQLGISCCIASIRNTIEEVMPHFAIRHEETLNTSQVPGKAIHGWSSCVLTRCIRFVAYDTAFMLAIHGPLPLLTG